MRARALARHVVGVTLTSALALAGGLLPTATAHAGTQNLNLDVSGANGSGSMSPASLSCADGGSGTSWHEDYAGSEPAGVFTSLGWNVDLHLDVHSDGTGPGQTVYSGGFMPDGMSRVALSNSRGTMLLGLTSPNDSCTKAGLSFDGTTVSGTGTWSVTSANGSYRQASGSGNYNIVQAHVAPGAINSFHLTLTGSITVLSPAMQISLVSTSWGNLGLDYVSRIVTATYQIKNVGTGDSFAPTLTSATSHADGVTSLGPVPQALDDLAAGASTQVSVKYQLALLQPCQLVILNCSFGTTVGVNMPDALDVPFPQTSANVQVIAPTLPPPL